MMGVLVLLSVTITLVIILARPKYGTFLIWIVLFTYPHNWWYSRGFLPLNMGFDDLLCVFLFLIVLIRRNFLEGMRFRFSYGFWVITAFAVIKVVANYSGSLENQGAADFGYIKGILKSWTIWGLFYAILHCIDNKHDLKIQLTMFAIAAVIGAMIVILQNYFPYQMDIFSAPQVYTTIGPTYEGRVAGAFMGSNAAACVLGCCLVMVITAIRLQKSFISKMIIYSFIFILLTGVLFTRSRAGLLALAGTFLPMSLMGRNKKNGLLVIIAALIISFSFPEMRMLYVERFREAYDPQTKVWGRNVVGRVQIWKDYFKTASLSDYLFGQGPTGGVQKVGTESHSAYVSLFVVYGFSSVIWAILLVFIFLKKAFSMKNAPDSLISTVSGGCSQALLFWGIYALSADALSSGYSQFLLFYIVILIDRASYFNRQDQEELLYYNSQDSEFVYGEEKILS